MNKWDSLVSYNIFGSGTVNYSTRIPVDAGGDVSDGLNTVQFEPLSDPDTIAVTTVWGYFYGAARPVLFFKMPIGKGVN